MDSSGNGHRLKTIRPTILQGGILEGFRGSTIQKTGKCGQIAGPIGNKFCTYNADESGNEHRLEQIGPMRHQREHFDPGLSRGNFGGFRGGSIFIQKSGDCHDIQRKQIKINFLKTKCTDRYNYAATIRGEAG